MATVEINFDGIVGPTHNYAGLAHGNLASQKHRLMTSNPRQAALEGLAKMKFLADIGVPQAVLPPHERPNLIALRRLGFSGSDAQLLQQARAHAPEMLSACYSASAMWAANAATVCPSADSADGRVHLTPANLVSQFHRSLEAEATLGILLAIFRDTERFCLHLPLPETSQLGDEGAANHMRLASSHGAEGIQAFVYGRSGFAAADRSPTRFAARQTLEASKAVARLHLLDPNRTMFIKQNPLAIDAGAFHNDVVAVANENVLFCHEQAFEDCNALSDLPRTVEAQCGGNLEIIEVPASRIALNESILTYLFNSQLISLPQGMALICPIECRESPVVREYIDELLSKSASIKYAHFVDVRQSMHNGGGPACLRLRVALTERERAAVAPGVFLTDALYDSLVSLVKRRYRDRLHPDDLADPKLIDEVRDTLDEMSRILGLEKIYPFQLG